MNHINAGITTAQEERDILRNSEGSAYSGIPEEIEEPDIDLTDFTNEEEVNEETVRV